MHRYAVIALCLFLLGGCGSRVVAAESEPAQAAQPTETVLGKIKEINGNEILLALAEESQRRPGEGDSGFSPQGEGAAEEQPRTGAPSPGTEQEGRTGREAGEQPAAGAPPSGESAGGAPGSAENGAGPGSGGTAPGGEEEPGGTRQGTRSGRGGNGQGPASSVSVTLTGEEQSYLIPVTASVTTGEGENARTIRFTQLAVKNVIRLGLDGNGGILSVEVVG